MSPPASGGSVAEAASISAAARCGSAPEAECDPGGGTRVTSPCGATSAARCATDTVLVAAPLPPKRLAELRGQSGSSAVSGHLFTPELAEQQIEARVFSAQCNSFFIFFSNGKKIPMFYFDFFMARQA